MRRAGPPLLALLLVLGQCYLSDRIEISGLLPQIPVVFVVFWGLWSGPRDAFYFGFWTGLAWGLIGAVPLGFQAAELAVLGAAVGFLGRWLNRDSSAVRFMLVFLVTLVSRSLLLVTWGTEGASWGGQVWLQSAVLASLYTGVLAVPLLYCVANLPAIKGLKKTRRIGVYA